MTVDPTPDVSANVVVEEEPDDLFDADYMNNSKVESTPVISTTVNKESKNSDAFNISALVDLPVKQDTKPKVEVYYYRSGLDGLKQVAHELDSSSRKASLYYALTMYAGLSLHTHIKPFSVIHSYIRPEDKTFFEKMLQLTPSDKNNAQLCLLSSSDDKVFEDSYELLGLYVVSNDQLKEDLQSNGENLLSNHL
jgi:hypothetical protein